MNKINKTEHKINEDLACYTQLRLVGDNVQQGVFSYNYCISIAEQLELDLVCISESANPPVCRVINYQKFLYQQKKKEKENKQTKVELKEIKFGPQIGENDYQVKLRHAQEFLKNGNKVKAFVLFTGRQIAYKDQGIAVLNRFIKDLEDISQVESSIKMEGNRKMILILSPKKKK